MTDWRKLPIPQKVEEIIAARSATSGTAAAIAKHLSEKFGCDVARGAVIGVYARQVESLIDYPLLGLQGGGAVKPLLRAARMATPKVKAKVDAYAAPAVEVAWVDKVYPPTIKSLEMSLLDLAKGDCRWPSEGIPPFTFCGHNTHAGSSYCPHHYKLSLGPGSRSERAAASHLKRAA